MCCCRISWLDSTGNLKYFCSTCALGSRSHIFGKVKGFLSEPFMLTYKNTPNKVMVFGNEIFTSRRFAFRFLLVIALQYSCLKAEGKGT